MAVGNNTSYRIECIRNEMLSEYEKSYIRDLLKNPNNKELFQKFRRIDAHKLCNFAIKGTKKLESGHYKDAVKIEKVRSLIALALYAIDNVHPECIKEVVPNC